MQKLLDEFLFGLNKIQRKFTKLLEQLENDLSLNEGAHKKSLNKFKTEFDSEHKEISEKLDYLNAEIFRYGFLLKKECNVTDLSGVLKDRFDELENAVSEYVCLKTSKHQDEHNATTEKLESDHKILLAEIKQRKKLLEDEFIDKIDLQINQLEQLKKEKINANKQSCTPEFLCQFDDASFENSADEFCISESKIDLLNTPEKRSFQIPNLIHFKDTQNLVIYYDKQSEAAAESISDVMILRMLISHLPDKLKIHIYDKNMNEKFREFLSVPEAVIVKGYDWNQFTQHLNQFEGEIRAKSGRVWSDVISDHTIHEYNVNLVREEKYDDIVSYYLYVFDDFLSFLNQQEFLSTMQRLEKLINYSCNAIFLVKVDDELNKEKLASFKQALQGFRIKTIDLTGGEVDVKREFFTERVEYKNIELKQKKTIIGNFLNSFQNLETSRSKLKYISYLVGERATWFINSAAAEVKIHIGKSQQTIEFETMSFKTKDMLSNALLCGGVGSGKTNFLKGVITSIALNYSPESVEMWLIDMKNGAGFSIFHNEKLPHVTKYAFSAESELINDIFYQLKRQMEDRYAYFTKFSVDNLEDASKLADVDPSKLKRIILIIDEFATIFSDDAPYLDEISANVLEIIRKGRAMGINMLLAAQNFNNIRSSSFAKAVIDIPIRILLKSSPEASHSVLGSSNHASVEITRIGQGLINTNFGELNSEGGNNFFKSFLLDNDDLKPLLEDIRHEVESRKLKVSPVKFIDGSLPASFDKNLTLLSKLSESAYLQQYNKHGIDCYLGETYLMSNDAHFAFLWKINGRQSTQNIVITGNERRYSMQAVFSTLSSLCYGIPQAAFRVNFLNSLDDDFSADLALTSLSSLLKNYDFEYYKENDLENLILQLEQLLEERRNSEDRIPVITYFIGMEKLVRLHKMEFSESDLANKLKVLLSTGSSYGIYFVCEINKPSNLDKISRDILGFIEHRICFSLNADESSYFINSKLANKLIDLDAPNIRNRAIYYSLSEGSASKFKAYGDLINENALFRELNAKVEYKLMKPMSQSRDSEADHSEKSIIGQDSAYTETEKFILKNFNIEEEI